MRARIAISILNGAYRNISFSAAAALAYGPRETNVAACQGTQK
ncbi:hypothetical protein GCM10017653_43540 [Ancylobacter defluvii]|uniref:Uncharacterized protein n=1 Tax=Ancylobacter defluvii TaxID=1282440 RepID=A0A9W6K2I0_9HYPH|nr:hypothetical protein GCM10017653_43540 [Ancylobacter defluvii]